MSRYFQQMLVPEIGKQGHEAISAAKVLVTGAGGLGIPVAAYLCAAGVGCLGIADGDTVAASNLQRQFLYYPTETGMNKAEVLRQKLALQNPAIEIKAHSFFLSEANAAEAVKDYDIICDCTDRVDARLLLDNICHQFGKPLVYAAVRGWEGYLTVLNHKKQIRLADVFQPDEMQQQADNNCGLGGIVGTTCGTLGSLQANEVLKIILQSAGVLDGEILCINIFNNTFRSFKIKKPARVHKEL